MRYVKILLIVLAVTWCKFSFATHNRAGEITYRQIGSSPFTLEFTVTTYTNVGPLITADRCFVAIYFGDGDSCVANRINGPLGTPCDPTVGNGVIISPGIKENIYKCIHTYSGGSMFTVSMTDPNRNDGINNIPNSVNVPFYIETIVTISPFLGVNNSPVLYNPPIDNACTCKKFIHNPNAIDPDGDSLSYELGICKTTGGNNVQGYSLPAGATIDHVTGDFVWACPGPNQGEYNFLILIISWRHGQVLDTISRDMQITVDGSCNNNPPVIEAQDICIDAGSNLSFVVTATDPDNNDLILTATGALFSAVPNAATFPASLSGPSPQSGTFNWQTTCADVRKTPYQVSFKAVDIPFSSADQSLADIKTIQIRVVSPGPTNLTASPAGTSINLNWTPTICSQATGYKIYRRNGPSGFVPGQCVTGIPASTGYSFIDDVSGSSTSNYTDDNNGAGLIHGIDYCYMIFAYFTDGSESYASNEDCTALKKDVPIITHVTVDSTDINNGANTIRWSPPSRSELDTITFPGPYKYLITKSSGALCNTLAVVDSIENVTLPGITTDTIFKHIDINTDANSNSYKIEFYNMSPRKYIGVSHCASSVYLDLTPGDNKLTLEWTSSVPWSKDSSVVMRKNEVTGVFDSIGIAYSAIYVDTGLVNGRTYCYFVKTYGHYSASGIVSPLINFSQRTCGVPVDNEAPCSPTLAITPNCDSIMNYLSWNNPNLTCADDVLSYRIYYSTSDTGGFDLITAINDANTITFEHNNNNISIAGCYYITALDSLSNESLHSDTVCADNCPNYELPNVFSPNNDGQNDYFRPFPYKYVESVDIQIYNRWGNLIFSSTDPEIMWDGKIQKTGVPCTDGVYYYICKVNTLRLAGIVTENLHGFVQLFTSPPGKSN